MSLKDKAIDDERIGNQITFNYDDVKNAILEDIEDFDLVIAAITKLDETYGIKPVLNILETYKTCKRIRFGDFK